MTVRERLQHERRGALEAVQAIKKLRSPRRAVAVDLAIGMAEHAVRQLVEDYNRRIHAPAPQRFELTQEATDEQHANG